MIVKNVEIHQLREWLTGNEVNAQFLFSLRGKYNRQTIRVEEEIIENLKEISSTADREVYSKLLKDVALDISNHISSCALDLVKIKKEFEEIPYERINYASTASMEYLTSVELWERENNKYNAQGYIEFYNSIAISIIDFIETVLINNPLLEQDFNFSDYSPKYIKGLTAAHLNVLHHAFHRIAKEKHRPISRKDIAIILSSLFQTEKGNNFSYNTIYNRPSFGVLKEDLEVVATFIQNIADLIYDEIDEKKGTTNLYFSKEKKSNRRH